MDEPEAVKRARAGDQAAFRTLVDRYGDLACRTAYLMVHDRSMAEDLAQEAFLAAWRGLPGFDARRPFKPWLLRIVVNGCLNERRRRAAVTVPLEGAARDEPHGSVPSAERAALAHDQRRQIDRAVAALNEDQRQVVMLRYFAGLSVPEIAEVLACAEGTIKSRLHRSLAQLRAHLEGLSDLAGVS